MNIIPFFEEKTGEISRPLIFKNFKLRLEAFHVGPAEFGGVEPGAVGAFHDAVIQGDFGAGGVGVVHEDGVADLGFPAAEEFGDVGDELFQFFADDGGLEEEDTGVPEELAGADEDFGQFLGRFFGEGFHLQGAVQFPGIAALLDLDVAEVHVGVLGDDAEGHQDVVAGDELEHLADGGREQFLVPDDKVTRGGDDEGVGVAGEDGVGGEGHAGGCLPGVRFQQEVPFRDLG